jgi:hypothetical protein
VVEQGSEASATLETVADQAFEAFRGRQTVVDQGAEASRWLEGLAEHAPERLR